MGHSMAREDNEEDKPSLDEMITARTELTQWSTMIPKLFINKKI